MQPASRSSTSVNGWSFSPSEQQVPGRCRTHAWSHVDASKLDWRGEHGPPIANAGERHGDDPRRCGDPVAISGSAYRRPGAKLLVDERGRTVRAGFVVAQTGTP